MFRVPTQSLLRSFWLALVLTAVLLLGSGLWALDYSRAALWALAAGTVCAFVGMARPGLARRPYETWTRLSRKGRRAARLWLTGVLFVVVTMVGWLGGRVAWKRPEPASSGWIPRSKLPIGNGGGADLEEYAPGAAGWTRQFAGWAWRTDNAWAWALLPLLGLLKGVEGESAGSLGGNVYTLY